jgi:hypothetical protein
MQEFKLVFLEDGTFKGVEKPDGTPAPAKTIGDKDAERHGRVQIEIFQFIHKNPICCIRHGNREYCWC